MADFRDINDQSLTDLPIALHREATDPANAAHVVQELEVHQIELELQNRELRAAQQALEESRDRYADLYDFAPIAYATMTGQGRITQMNLTAAQLLGVERGRVPDLLLGARLAPESGRALLDSLSRALRTGEDESLEVGLGRAPEARRDLRLIIRRERPSLGEEARTACRVILLDITEHLQLTARLQERELQLEHLVQHDTLTGLPNRLLFADRLGQAIRQAHREQRQVALLFLDLDGFKSINDSLGHPAGDQVLKQAATRMLGLVREGDTVARLGGDEFTVILAKLKDGSSAGLVAHKLNEVFRRPFTVDGRTLYVTTSIGISLFPQDGSDVNTLVRNADSAMYLAKERGRDTFRFYTEDMTARVFAQFSLETALRQALVNEEFVLHYQPQLDLATGRIVGLEALIRWNHPTMGMVEPLRFIPLAESTGLIVPISVWIVRTACTQMKAWQDQGLLTDAAVRVNLSNRDMQNPDLAEIIGGIVRAVGLNPAALAVEITETWIMANPESAAGNIRHLQSLGIEVGIDDFGTGYSSLASLKRLAVHELKIDQSFVAGLPEDADGCAIARAVIALGEALGLKVVAEGVETQAHAQFLTTAGCRIGQGYLYSRPLPAEEFESYVRRQGLL